MSDLINLEINWLIFSLTLLCMYVFFILENIWFISSFFWEICIQTNNFVLHVSLSKMEGGKDLRRYMNWMFYWKKTCFYSFLIEYNSIKWFKTKIIFEYRKFPTRYIGLQYTSKLVWWNLIWMAIMVIEKIIWFPLTKNAGVNILH